MQDDMLNQFVSTAKAVYVQTRGPRFETRAEIRQIKQFGDVVGMTAGDEATMACELGIPYVMLCIVDNLAHGIGKTDDSIASMENFKQAQRVNLMRTERAVLVALEALRGGVSIVPSLSRQLSAYACETLIFAKYVATVNDDNVVLHDGMIAINDVGEIIGVHSLSGNMHVTDTSASSSTSTSKTSPLTPPPPYRARNIHRFPDGMIIPGLINAHTHAAMALMRGFGDDLHLTDWLVTKIWPAEARCVSKNYVRDGTIMAIEEMIAGGTTTFHDLYFFPNEIQLVAETLGIRAVVGQVIIEFPSAMAKDGDDYLRQMQENLQKQKERQEEQTARSTLAPTLVTLSVTPHAPYSVSEQHMIECKALALTYGVPFHTHLHECEEEINASVALDKKNGFCHRCDFPGRPLEQLHRLGLLDETCSFAHMTQLTEEEIILLSEKKCSVVHCPSSNMKLASGFCPVARLQYHGVNVALGTDGAASNNSLDMIAEMKLAALLGKGVAKSAMAVSAKTALRMATINGAKALGLDKVCGSIEVGKRADVVVLDFCNQNSCRPVFDPISTLVYASNRACVRNVWIDGKLKLDGGVRVVSDAGDIKTDEASLRSTAERWQIVMQAIVKELDE